MVIRYNKPIHVPSMHNYGVIMLRLRGRVAGRIDENGKCWIKLWHMRSKYQLKEMLTSGKL